MAGYELFLTQEENVTVSVPAVRRLVECGSGDAALLYLCLLKNRGAGTDETLAAELRWSTARLRAAEDALAGAGLIARPDAAPPVRENVQSTAPEEYSRADIAQKLERDTAFASLLREVERKLGTLSTPSVGKLLGLYEGLGFGADVIFLLVGHCVERAERRYGEGKRPTMREIEKEGYRWARLSLFTVAAADEYLRSYNEKLGAIPQLMRVLRLGDRAPVAAEEKYLTAWIEMGFAPEAVALAYDKTVLKCHEFKWPYCNGILKRWHAVGVHTVAEIEQNDRPAPKPAQTPAADDDIWKYV